AIWQIASISHEPRFMVLHYSDRRRIELLAKRSPVEVRIVDNKRAYVPAADWDVAEPSGRAWLQLAKAVLSGQAPAPTGGRAASAGSASGAVTKPPAAAGTAATPQTGAVAKPLRST